MAETSSSCGASVEMALGRGDFKGAATIVQEALRAVSYDGRKSFFTQLCTALLRRARTDNGAPGVAKAGELLWTMPEFRTSSSAASSMSGETLLLASVLATAYMTMHNYEKVLVFDCELLQSPAFFTYDGLTATERLACVARILAASRMTSGTRYVDSAVHKGTPLYYGLAKSCERLDVAAQRQRDAVMCTYLFELACYRQQQKDYLRAFQSLLALYERNKQPEALCRAALTALCIRASEGVRQAALQDVLHRSSSLVLPSLYAYLQQAYNQQLFRAADTAALLTAAEAYVAEDALRNALREHNILLLAKTFDCVYWRSLCVHMDDASITEEELYDLLVEMVLGQRLSVAIHQDTGFIEFGEDEAGVGQRVAADADVFNRIAKTTAVIAAARPDLLS
ncbi:putative cop9 signalosome complex subunit [Leptomonas seymouri]|uniref:Putative cop9 signalosome complex subunit n=1 Tax=Leptomonas seymouri TaxID=5684 RepID=A0A0N0P2K5_LEPSE|nr:putative cop9 signalosome complex subunit [Leptomonas seymouri]|eukprot:KPI83056.1 putative cop9 signalosome complex subunit [Leptomonas seymouri]